MPLKSGMNSSLGLATEAAWGTYQAPTRHLPHVSWAIAREDDRNESEGIIAGRRVLDADQWAPGNVTVEGDIELELYDRSIGMLFTHMFGAVVTAGAGPYTHTYTPGDLTGKGLTLQAGVPDTTDGTVHPFSALGCKVSEWEIACSAGEIASLTPTVVAKNLVTTEALVAPSYAAGIGIGMTFIGASLTVAGVAYKTMELTLAGSNGLNADRRFLGDGLIDEPLESELREYTAEISSEFFNLTMWNRFINGTTAALVAHFARGTSTLDVTMNVRFDGDTPEVEGRDVIPQTVNVKAIGDTDAAAITAVLTNSDATP
jgi:hypothetical protein